MTLWPSRITPDLLVSGSVGISEVMVDGLDIYWAETRPTEGGRTAIMGWSGGRVVEVTAPTVNVRSRVHEYGGGAWCAADGVLVYSDDAADGELFELDVSGGTADGESRQLTTSGYRYADGRLSPDGSWFVCVRERHDGPKENPVANEIVAVSRSGGAERVLLSSHDFVSNPRFSADGSMLVCVAWDHPNMAFDNTELVVGPFNDGVWEPTRVPGPDQSILQPGFIADGRLLAVSDRSDWWNLVSVDLDTGAQDAVVSGTFEMAWASWALGYNSWTQTPDGGIVAVASTATGDHLLFPDGAVDTTHGSITAIRAIADGRVAYAASSFDEGAAVWVHDGVAATRITERRDLGLDPAFFPAPEHITFDVAALDPAAAPGTVAHALFYAPANPDYDGDAQQDPPLVVMAHGGPTGAARRSLSLAIRFWTSRGVAVVDVDYRGSTLYGRRYRDALDNGWGIVDVVDCVAAATYLAGAGRVDPDTMVIAGGSAGGLTVLNALAHHDVFAGGISRYGVTDLRALAADTHKFESRYLDDLIGPWPEAEAVYVERSPINHADKISAPMLVLQGLDDKVVPPSQAEAIVEALRANDVPVTYVEFAGEGHGFRRSENIVKMLEAELAFVESL